MLTFTRRTLPPKLLTTFSRIGVSCLHGSHQLAQKSTNTTALRDASSTSLAKVAAVASLITSAPPRAPGCAESAGFMRKSISTSKPACGCNSSHSVTGRGHRQDARLVSAGPDEREQVVGPNIGGRRVRQRMIVEPFITHHIGIEDNGHPPGPVIDEGKRRDRARGNAENLEQQLRPPEAQTLAAQGLM